jgi:2-isopropylmalate synthase
MRAEDVGQQPEQIRLGRHSGRHGLFSRLEKLGISVPEERREEIYRRFLALADLKKEIYDEDLRRLVEERETANAAVPFQLIEMHVATGTHRAPEAEVQVYHRSTHTLRVERATGDGPVNAIYKAIDRAIGAAHELISYELRSVTEGADAVGEVTVLIGFNGACFRGVAQHTDVLRASAEAYLEAINQLEQFRIEHENLSFVRNGILHSFGDAAA